MMGKERDLISRIQTLTEQMISFKKEKAKLDSQMKNSNSLIQQMDQVSEEVRRLKEKLAQSEGKVRELEEENQIKEDLLLQKQRPAKEQLFGKSLHQIREEQ